MTVVDEPTPVIHSSCSPNKLTPNVGISTTTTVPTSRKHVPQIACEEESPKSKITQLESDKKSKLSDSTKSEVERPLTRIPPVESGHKSELSDSTKHEEEWPLPQILQTDSDKKCEDEIDHHEIREMKDLHLDIPHIQRERMNDLCESKKCEIEIIPHYIIEMSEPQHNIPLHPRERISELCESTKQELDVFPHNINEMSDPSNKRGEDYFVTNDSQNSLSFQYVQMQRSYLASLF